MVPHELKKGKMYIVHPSMMSGGWCSRHECLPIYSENTTECVSSYTNKNLVEDDIILFLEQDIYCPFKDKEFNKSWLKSLTLSPNMAMRYVKVLFKETVGYFLVQSWSNIFEIF
jgi:hypothetical protein